MSTPNVVRRAVREAERHERLVLASLVAVVLFAGAAYSFYLGSAFRYLDEYEYHRLAENLLRTGSFSFDGVHPSAFRPPGYPAFLAALMALGAQVPHLRLPNFVAFAGCMWLAHRMLRQRYGSAEGLLGAGMMAVYPVVFYAAGTLFPQVLGGFLLLFVLHLLLDSPRDRLGPYVAAGLLYGLLLLLIPSFLFTLLVIAGWTLLFGPKVPRRGLAALVLLPALMTGAWSLRTYRVFHSFVYGSANSGYMLYHGNCDAETVAAEAGADLGTDDVAADRHYRRRAMECIASDPARAARVYAGKVLRYFTYRDDLKTKAEMSPGRDLVMLVTYGPLLLLAVARVLLAWRRPLSPFERLIVVVYATNAFYAAVFFTRIRYRLPLDLLLILLAAGFLGELLRGDAAGQRRPGAAAAAA